MLDDLVLLIFFLSGIAILHTYLFFPFLMSIISKIPQEFSGDIPPLKAAILMSVYNEEQVIKRKMDSMLNTKYPLELLEIWVGSDCSSDKTDEILMEYAQNFSNVHFIRFNERTGKPQIINQLQKQVQADILILTDADTIFHLDTISELIRPFNNTKIGGVQALFISTAPPNKDVSYQEVAYNNREVMIKRGESRLGCVIGAYGACYALRNDLYVPVPKNFIVDDFFLFMNVLKKGFYTVVNEKAICEMEISGDSKIEFQRKIRIGSGNFQNFFYFKSFWLPFTITSWVYWSHKVLRWFTPFFLAQLLLCNIYILKLNSMFITSFVLQLIIYFIGFIDSFLEKISIQFNFFRFIKHFLFMNFALFLGFIKFVNGIPKSSWDTKN
jgi:cellulose synthase/poly-beta-1,6-N-acetylglucosamine synthase-like glycosyltransferase